KPAFGTPKAGFRYGSRLVTRHYFVAGEQLLAAGRQVARTNTAGGAFPENALLWIGTTGRINPESDVGTQVCGITFNHNGGSSPLQTPNHTLRDVLNLQTRRVGCGGDGGIHQGKL